MAALQVRSNVWRVIFTFRNKQYSFPIGKVDEGEAKAVAAKIDYVLMRIKQQLLEVPDGMDIVTFLQHDGKPPVEPLPAEKHTALAEFRDSFLKTFGNGALEDNTLYTAKIHLSHLAKTLGERFDMNALTLADLQKHIARRQKTVAGITIKKEIDTARSAWNWAERMGMVHGDFPSGGLVYPKGEDKLPFMTWKEIERRIAAGGDPDALWECLYLNPNEIEKFLHFVKTRKAPPWVYLMLVFAAHTGARRSEMIRARLEDVDLAGEVVTIREKKRVKGRLTTRQVPLSSLLASLLKEWLDCRVGKAFLFGKGVKQLSPQGTQHAFEKVLKESKWSVVKGWHVLRHSFISALASRGVDQRIIDEFVGHQSEAMRRRYRHLYPSTKLEAIKLVFG